jgi:N-acetylmuramic acid 6-phosphate etherase
MHTEQNNLRTQAIDQADTLSLLTLINAEDQTVAQAVAHTLPAIALAVDAIADRLQRGGRLFYVGAGTSGRLGILDASECPPTYGTSPQMVQGIIAGGSRAISESIEGVEDDRAAGADDLRVRELGAQDVVVGIAASGRTPYVLGALAYARERGAMTIALSNNQPAPILEAAEIGIAVVTGAEVIAGSTRMKAGTAQKLVLNMLSTGTMIKLGKVYGNLMVDVQIKNEKLLHRARHIMMQITGISETAAIDLLEAAGRDVKVAIVMAKRQVTADAARALLMEAGGSLRRVIG